MLHVKENTNIHKYLQFWSHIPHLIWRKYPAFGSSGFQARLKFAILVSLTRPYRAGFKQTWIHASRATSLSKLQEVRSVNRMAAFGPEISETI